MARSPIGSDGSIPSLDNTGSIPAPTHQLKEI